MNRDPLDDRLAAIRSWAEGPHRDTPSPADLQRARSGSRSRRALLGAATLLISLVVVTVLSETRGSGSHTRATAPVPATSTPLVAAGGRVVPLVLTSGTRLYLVVPAGASIERGREVAP